MKGKDRKDFSIYYLSWLKDEKKWEFLFRLPIGGVTLAFLKAFIFERSKDYNGVVILEKEAEKENR